VVKEKTSIYIDRELWRKFKKYVLKRGMDISSFLEDIIRSELIEEALDSILLKLAGLEDYYEADFEPIKPKEGLVSELVRVMNHERSGDIPG